MNKVLLQTFGCQMNESDSEIVRTILIDAGYEFVDNDVDADIIMLNTCSVRENAHRKVYGHIHQMRHHRKGKPVLIGILGCMATGLRKELVEDKHLALDFVVGPDSYKRLPQILKEIQDGDTTGYDVTLSEFETYADVYPTRTSGVNAWVSVMRGCNNFCSFCIVPFTRGRERSRSVKDILEEIRRLAGEGFRQVTLLGQNVNSYMHDGRDFAFLMDEVSKVKGVERIRFTSPHPKDFPDSLIKVLAGNPKVCKQVHLPLQAGNDRVLSAMNRHYTQADFLTLVEKLLAACPALALSTDVIVGFPTETDAEFEDTVHVMKHVRFDSAFIFKYSSRPNTEASRTMKDDVLDDAKTRRIVRLNMIQKDISLEKNKALIGAVQPILIEQIESGDESCVIYGRNDANKIVVLAPVSQGALTRGEFVNARIIAATPYQLKGEVA